MEEKIYHNPVGKYASEYNMRHTERGNAIIFNHRTFTKQDDRPGTDVDRNKLIETFKQMGFLVECYDDLPYYDIKCVFERQSKSDHANRDCIAFVFLTHGNENGEIYAYDKPFQVESLFNDLVPLNCPSLTGKPKLFFVQACRGGKADQGVTVQHNRYDLEYDGPGHSTSNPFRIPMFTDFFISYATFPGFVAFRNPDTGTPYVKHLCDIFDAAWKEDEITTMMTTVTQRVAIQFESNPGRYKSSPFYNSSLTRSLKFREKN